VIRPNDAELIPFAELPKFLPPGRRGRPVSPKTLHRWATHGLRGVKLQYVQAGGRRCSTMPQIDAFFARLTEVDRRAGCKPDPVMEGAEANSSEADALAVGQRLSAKYFQHCSGNGQTRPMNQAL
jgi:hypothetical protein